MLKRKKKKTGHQGNLDFYRKPLATATTKKHGHGAALYLPTSKLNESREPSFF